jgi:hypothetical protein
MAAADQRLVQAIRRDLGAPESWIDVHTYPNSLAECLIDALWSERVRYSVIADIMQRYRGYRAEDGHDADTDSAQDLLDSFSMGLDEWMNRIGNRQRAYARDTAPFKAELVLQGAQAAVATDILTTEDLRRDHTRYTAGYDDFKHRWFALPAQHSGLTWERLLLVADVKSVPPNGWIVEYVGRATDADSGRALGPAAVEPMLESAAQAVGSTPLRLRNAIWRYETARDRRLGGGPTGSHGSHAGAGAGQA